MNTESSNLIRIVPFTADLKTDAVAVVRQIFGHSTSRIINCALENPILKHLEKADAGEIAYADSGEPIAFDAAILRTVCYKGQKYLAVVGSTLGVLAEYRRTLVVYDLLKKIAGPRFGSVMFFGNSANKDGARINRAFGMTGNAPSSCAIKRIAVVRPLHFMLYLIRSKVFKMAGYSDAPLPPFKSFVTKINGIAVSRLHHINTVEFDRFWDSYRKRSKGFVCSRTAEELNWLFAKGVREGGVVICAAREDDNIIGDVVFKTDVTGRVWKVADLVAIDNRLDVLDALLRGGLRILRNTTHAVHCEVSGFPDFVQSVIKKSFGIVRPLGNNHFAWKLQPNAPFDLSFEDLNSPDSWFFGAYDGDNCI